MEIEFLRNLAIIWLSLFCMVGLIVPIVGLYFAIRGMSAATTFVPRLLGNAHSKTSLIRANADRLSGRVAAPVLSTQQKMIQAGETMRALGVRAQNEGHSEGDVDEQR